MTLEKGQQLFSSSALLSFVIRSPFLSLRTEIFTIALPAEYFQSFGVLSSQWPVFTPISEHGAVSLTWDIFRELILLFITSEHHSCNRTLHMLLIALVIQFFAWPFVRRTGLLSVENMPSTSLHIHRDFRRSDSSAVRKSMDQASVDWWFVTVFQCSAQLKYLVTLASVASKARC